MSHRGCPYFAGAEGALPGRVAPGRERVGGKLVGGGGGVVGVCVGNEEVGDNLKGLSEEIREEGGLGAGGVDSPRSATRASGQASIALSTKGVAYQEGSVSRGWGNRGRSRWRHDFLRCRLVDCAECTCEHESGREQVPNSRSRFYSLINVVAHLFVLQLFLCYFNFNKR